MQLLIFFLDRFSRAHHALRNGARTLARVERPSVYWAVGGTDPQTYARAKQAGRVNELPSNHSPEFAPVIYPTLRAGVVAMLAAAGAWLTRLGWRP